MKRKILSFLLLSFFIVNAYSQSFNAATELSSVNSNGVAQVKNAWQVVGNSAPNSVCNTPTGIASIASYTFATVSWGSVSGAIRYTLQYKQSSDSAWTTTIILDTSHILTGLTPNTNYKFRVRSVCGVGSQSAYSSVAPFKTTLKPAYCFIDGDTYYAYIDHVSIGAINNSSGDDSGYGDYTSLSTNLSAGVSNLILISSRDNGLDLDEYYQVYIDYNQDKDFADAHERVVQGHHIGQFGKSFTVPASALNGKTRMRITMKFAGYLDTTCTSENGFHGEAEDYSVKITGGTPALTVVAAESDVKTMLNSIMVSPNPVKGSSANLVLQADKPGAVNIKIADLSGRALRSETINGIIAGKNSYSLRNINLLPGTYMIIAQQSNAVIARAQFIVNK